MMPNQMILALVWRVEWRVIVLWHGQRRLIGDGGLVDLREWLCRVERSGRNPSGRMGGSRSISLLSVRPWQSEQPLTTVPPSRFFAIYAFSNSFTIRFAPFANARVGCVTQSSTQPESAEEKKRTGWSKERFHASTISVGIWVDVGLGHC